MRWVLITVFLRNTVVVDPRHDLPIYISFLPGVCFFSPPFFIIGLLFSSQTRAWWEVLTSAIFWTTSRGHRYRCRPFSPSGTCLYFLSRLGFSIPAARWFSSKVAMNNPRFRAFCMMTRLFSRAFPSWNLYGTALLTHEPTVYMYARLLCIDAATFSTQYLFSV